MIKMKCQWFWIFVILTSGRSFTYVLPLDTFVTPYSVVKFLLWGSVPARGLRNLVHLLRSKISDVKLTKANIL